MKKTIGTSGQGLIEERSTRCAKCGEKINFGSDAIAEVTDPVGRAHLMHADCAYEAVDKNESGFEFA